VAGGSCFFEAPGHAQVSGQLCRPLFGYE
jgi:hypothetical protein